MVRGQPDFGLYAAKSALASVSDIGELAARLGALQRYDRLGDVIAFEDFTNDLGMWETELSGLGSEVVVTAERFVTGGFSCRMTAGSTLSRYAGIRSRVPVPYSVIYGIEMAWTLDADMDYGYVMADIYTGVYHLAFGIKFVTATKLNYYYNAAAGWTAIPGEILTFPNDHYFVTTKFTFDITKVKYSRLLTPPRTTDLSSYSGFVFPDAVNRPRMEVSGRIYSNSGENAISYVDSLILTANDV